MSHSDAVLEALEKARKEIEARKKAAEKTFVYDIPHAEWVRKVGLVFDSYKLRNG